MKLNVAPRVLISLFLTLAAAGSCFCQQLVQNAGFETGDFTDWTETGDTRSLLGSASFLYAHSGTYGAQMGPSGSIAYISQSIPTIPGQSYYLSFWLDSPDGRTPNEFVVSWNGTNIFDQVNLAAIGWTNLAFTNLATTSNTILQFGFRDDPTYLGFDDVTVFRLPNAPSSSAAYTYSTLAGESLTGGTDGLAGNARFNRPSGIAVDAAGNLYVADTANFTIRKITPDHEVSTIAGFAGFIGSADGVGSDARFQLPEDVAVDNGGNIYVADSGNWTIRRIVPSGTNWVVSTIAGLAGNAGTNDGTGTNARFAFPYGLAVDSATNVYVADSGNATIRKITPVGTNWVVSTIAGQAGFSGYSDGTNSGARFEGLKYMAVDSKTNLYVTQTYAVQKITQSGTNWVVTTIGTNSGTPVSIPTGIAVDGAGNVYVSGGGTGGGVVSVLKMTGSGTSWTTTTLAGSTFAFGATDGTGTNARFYLPEGVAVDRTGTIYVADTGDDEVRRVTSAGVVSTIAGSVISERGGSTDGTGGQAQFFQPNGAAVDSSGTIYVADTGNSTIRQVTPTGVVSTMAGLAGSNGTNDGAGSNARFNGPVHLALDAGGNVYVADTHNHAIRMITPAGLVSTIAGLAGSNGFSDGMGTNARFFYPAGITVDGFGNVYVADNSNNSIRRIRPVSGNWMVTTIAGSATPGSADGTNSAAGFRNPYGNGSDMAGNIYVADSGNSTIRRIVPSGTNWVVSTIAGLAGNEGTNDGVGTNARFTLPYGLTVDSAGAVYVADSGNGTLRRITPVGTNWVVSTIGGVAGTYGSTDGAGASALFNVPFGAAVDSTGNLYVADTDNNTIRKGVFSQFANLDAVTFTQPPANGQITVTLLPPEAGGQWRFPWELAWRDSGATASNLVTGDYTIQFSAVPGYLAVPASGSVTIPPAGGMFQLTNLYYPTINSTDANGGSGALTVNLGYSPPAGAGWNFVGATTPFLSPGYTTNLVAGTYLIDFAPVGGFATPPTLSVQITGGQTAALQITYQLAQSPPANVMLPAPVPSGEISDLTDYPFGFNGQLETDVGYGSGVAVQTNVVLTAAHLIFNDQTLSYVSQAFWFYQEETGVFAPDPQPAQGWYVLSGYAAQRTNDLLGGLGPDQSSPQSRDFDVAALYFQTPVANGGQGGYLSSDATPNQWLSSIGNKLLVGYPVDGSQFGFTNIVPGEMYETGPQPYALSLATDPVNDQQVYEASWFFSYPGNSGGPLYVELNGYYYPAGVYLGTLFNGIVPNASAVRAIDSNVVNLITLAAALGDSGTNNSGGGVITIIPSQLTSAKNPGYLVLQLGPAAAVQAGAAWKLASQSASDYSSANPSLQEITSTNALVLQFKPVPGWNLPTNQSVAVTPGAILTNTAYYSVTNPVLTLDVVRGLGLSGTTNTSYQIQSNASLVDGAWVSFKTNTVVTNGFNLITNKPLPGFYRAVWLTN